jgi:hypothetical protein
VRLASLRHKPELIMRRSFLIASVVLLLYGLTVWFVSSRPSPGPRSQLTLTVDKTSHRAAPLQEASLQMTNAGSRTVDIFPMFSVETNGNDLNPFRGDAPDLGGQLQPGASRAVRIAFRDLRGVPFRVGVWYTEVPPPWKAFMQSWLGKAGLGRNERKILECSQWFAESPFATNTCDLLPNDNTNRILGWERGK